MMKKGRNKVFKDRTDLVTKFQRLHLKDNGADDSPGIEKMGATQPAAAQTLALASFVLDGLCFVPVLAILHHGNLLSCHFFALYVALGDPLRGHDLFYAMALPASLCPGEITALCCSWNPGLDPVPLSPNRFPILFFAR